MLVRYVQPLTDEQRALLEKTMKEDTAFRARSRAHSLLLSAAGTPIQTIAKTYQVHRVTCRPGSRNGNAMAPRVCMINLAVADRPNSPQTNRNSRSTISKTTPVRSNRWWND